MLMLTTLLAVSPAASEKTSSRALIPGFNEDVAIIRGSLPVIHMSHIPMS